MSIFKSFKANLLTVTILSFFFLLSGFNALSTSTKTLEGMSTSLFQQLSSFKGERMIEIQSVMSQLIELSKQDKFESYQRNSFDVLIKRTRDLVDDMLEEQRREDIQFRNVTNLLMKYHLRQTHALEIVKDKHKLSVYFLEFINSIIQTAGSIDIRTDYSKLISVLILLQQKFREYQEVANQFGTKFAEVYKNLHEASSRLELKIQTNPNPFKAECMKKLSVQVRTLFTSTQKDVESNYFYNVNPRPELEVITDYLKYFILRNKNETVSIEPKFFPNFDQETKDAREEVAHLGHILVSAEEAIKITDDNIKSNIREYNQNVKSRAQIVEVIYQILALMNKRSKKIKGYQLKYIDVARTKFFDYGNSYEFIAYTRYVFKEPSAEEIMKRDIPKLPELTGLQDKNAQAPQLQTHVPINSNPGKIAVAVTGNFK